MQTGRMAKEKKGKKNSQIILTHIHDGSAYLNMEAVLVSYLQTDCKLRFIKFIHLTSPVLTHPRVVNYYFSFCKCCN